MNTGQIPTILVIVGITGDLARRKLLPALREIAAAGELPRQFRVVGITRRELATEELLASDQILYNRFELFRLDLTEPRDYQRLADRLRAIETDFGAPAQHLYYLSVAPQISAPIVQLLGGAGLAAAPGAKLLLEKPFGTDLASAQDFITHTRQHFEENQIYRIDHYLAKEMAQNILVFRGSNALFKHTWNRAFIEKIHILASEDLGIEGRATFYEQTGALRDVVQSHVLQLAALVLMDTPPRHDWSRVSAARLAALSSLKAPTAAEVPLQARRGQYRGYREEVGNPHSATETFVSLTLFSQHPSWEGVPITLTAGKALDRKVTEVHIHYRRQEANESNRLVLRIQPREGIELDLWAKRPGYDRRVERVPLDFTYSRHFSLVPEAYERVLLDAIRSDRSLFASSEEVLASWRLLAPIQHIWSLQSDDLLFYNRGTAPDGIAAA